MVKQSPTAFMYIQDTFVPELNKNYQLIFNNILEKIRINQLYGRMYKSSKPTKNIQTGEKSIRKKSRIIKQ